MNNMNIQQKECGTAVCVKPCSSVATLGSNAVYIIHTNTANATNTMTTDNGKKHTPLEQFCDALHRNERDVEAAGQKKQKNITVKTIDDVFFICPCTQ